MKKSGPGKARKKKKTSGFKLIYVAGPLAGLGLIFLILGMALTTKTAGMFTFMGLVMLVAGGGMLLYEAMAPHLKRTLVFDDDALRMVRGLNKAVIGCIPYSNMATAEMTDHIVIGLDDEELERIEVDRIPVVGIRVYRPKDRDTFWPLKAEEEDSFDFYITDEFMLQFASVVETLELRMHQVRDQKMRKMHDK